MRSHQVNLLCLDPILSTSFIGGGGKCSDIALVLPFVYYVIGVLNTLPSRNSLSDHLRLHYSLISVTMESQKKIKVYDGSTNVKEFITICELECAVKGYDADDKKANYLASKLTGPAFDVYMRLTDDEKKVFETIKKELSKEFEKGNLDREEAIQILSTRTQLPKESVQTYAHKLSELVKLAYPKFGDMAQNTITKDYFVRGLHPTMQTALKSSSRFSVMDLNAATEETVRLELAGVTSIGKSRLSGAGINAVESSASGTGDDFIDSVAERVVEKLRSRDEGEPETVNWVDNQRFHRGNNRYWRGRGRGGYRGAGRGRGATTSNTSNTKKCRNCNETGHLVRECPKRYCQACGKQGHDQFNPMCEKYQL